ncbi:MAG: hypothetical protein K0B81_07965 [Candidatus Cloacimonetes bacterium]|nr:hypothetical protein [Candidatus Cloacimonadota bacterium]
MRVRRFPQKAREGIGYFFTCLLMLLVISSFTNVYAITPFTIVNMTESEIVLQFRMPDYELVPLEIEGIVYHIIKGNFSGYHYEEGYPDIPFYSENIGIPVDGDIQIMVQNILTERVSDVVIYPVEKLETDGYEVNQSFFRDRTVYNRNDLYPEQILQQGITGFAGDRRFASFVFNPIRFHPHNRQLSIIREATILISISGDKTISRDWIPGRNYIDRAGEMFFLNEEYSRNWRKPRNFNPDHEPIRSYGINAIQFFVDSEGIYKVTYEDLADIISQWEEEELFPVNIDLDLLDPRHLQLESKDGIVPIHFIGERDGSFDPGDYFEFFGDKNQGKTGYSDTYTAENVYTLKIIENWGARMSVENGGIRETNPSNYILPTSYEQTVHFEEQNAHYPLGQYSPAPREDLWFWRTIRAPDLNVTSFNLEYPHQTHIRAFSATVCLVGLTYMAGTTNDHRARVRINSSFINDHRWTGQTQRLFTNVDPIPNFYLNHGENFLYIDMPGDTPSGITETILFDYFHLTYWREYKTDSDYIRFTRPFSRPLGLYQFELNNFSIDQISVYKVNSGYMENLQIEPFSETGGAPYKVTFQDEVVAHNIQYVALTEDQKKIPKFIRPRAASDLRNPNNAADYIIITPRIFVHNEGTQLFKTFWESRGYLVEIVDLQSIFDEFNYGIRSAEAIKDFLTYVYHNWSIPMTHVLLLGKGLFDERDFSVHRSINHIPYKNIWTPSVGATPSDNWFACIIGDDEVPDFNISRITVWNENQILPVAEKTIHYMENPNYPNPWQSTITLAAGGKVAEGEMFAQYSESIRKIWIPEDYNVIRVYTNTQTLPSQYLGGTFKLKNSWDAGTLYVQFFGHGGGRIWADYNLLNNNDILTLNNEDYPFVNSLSCYPADFSRPGSGSIGETMILTPDRGAIAHFGTSGLSYTRANETLATHLTEALFHRNLGNFGDIVSYTKARVFSTVSPTIRLAMTHGAVMFGDPMVSFDLPEERVHIELNKYNITEGDTLLITVQMPDDILYARFLIQNEHEITLNVPFDMPVINGVYQVDYVVPSVAQSTYQRLVKIYGYGLNRQVLGMTNYTVGKAAVVDNVTIPETITASDPIHIAARFFDESGIQSVVCRIGANERPMIYNADENRYITVTPFNPMNPSFDPYEYYFIITNGNNQVITSNRFNFSVLAPDLAVYYLELSSFENQPAVKVNIRNFGQIASPPTIVRLTKVIDGDDTFLNEKDIQAIDPLDDIWIYIPFEPLQDDLRFRVRVNPNSEFAELDLLNNFKLSDLLTLNMFYAGVEEISVMSSDKNLLCKIPAGLFAEETIFYINSSPYKIPDNQPDVHKLALLNQSLSHTYQIGIFNETLFADTLGTLPDDKKITLTMNYDPEDPEIQFWENENRFAFYRWQTGYNKWIHHGGFTSTTNNHVYQDLRRLGTYTILRNNDQKAPTIRANVQDQEFTYGGYVSGTGIISFTLSDANGIDIFDQGIEMFLNGVLVDQAEYTISANPGNLTSIPIKHQLNLDAGNYTLSISCADVNGNFQVRDINFVVNTTFDVINLANYPNPVITTTIDPVNQNRTRFTYVLTDDADDVKIRVYTVSGRLVKTFDNLPTGVGYHEYPRTVLGWDCRDESGIFLANGVYFYKITARRGSKTIERTQKMAIVR